MKQKKKAKIYFVIYIAGKRFLFMMWLWSKFFKNGPLITTVNANQPPALEPEVLVDLEYAQTPLNPGILEHVQS